MKTIEVVAAIIQSGKTILATQRGSGDFKNGWEFPGGKIEFGETHEEALVREIAEELQFEIVVEKHIITVSYEYEKFYLNMACYLCSVKQGQPVLTEHKAMCWIDLETIDELDWLPADVEVIEHIKKSGII